MSLKSDILNTYPEIVSCDVDENANIHGVDLYRIEAYTEFGGKLYKHTWEFAKKNGLKKNEIVDLMASFLNGWESKIER